ncbi:MAG: ABC transporter permease subunit [Clostridia bacterium]|nr:ABC transporter permease subunit [Clostridia bacterium]
MEKTVSKSRRGIPDRVYNLIFGIVAIVIMWVVWIIAYYAEGNDYVIPAFSTTVSSMIDLFASKSFWVAFGNTMLRTLYAFLGSYVLAAIFAVLSSASRTVSAIMGPVVSILRSIPTMAIILILLLWTSHSAAPVLVGGLVTFPMVYSQMMASYGDVDKKLVDMAKVYGVSRAERIFKIYIPGSLPNILSQTGASFSLTLKVVVSGEIMSNTFRSIGGMMQQARSLYIDIPQLFALTLVTIIVGFVLEFSLSQLRHLCRKWKGGKA